MVVERILFSTDYPYLFRPGNDARQFLNQCSLDESGKAAFAYGNGNGMQLIGGAAYE
ncbi:hypothetical protein AAGR22_18225 [Erwinia sp. HDF1-3R]|uniref:hypothetical protein n=1 Tax=Erwinia sp. HDF1-3R TaxID=3141543 RepID=UPI0031F5B877